MAPSIKTLSIKAFLQHSINGSQHNNNLPGHYAVCRDLFIIMLNGIMLKVVMLSVVMLMPLEF